MPRTPNARLRLRKHADYQRVYANSRKQFSSQMSFFVSFRGPELSQACRSDTAGPRVGLTAGKVLGNAVERNRIKRRLRECVRRHAHLLAAPVDVVLHPRKTVLTLAPDALDREVEAIFRKIARKLPASCEVPGHVR